MFAVIFICGNIFLRIAEKVQELEPAKISCHTVYFVRNFKGYKYFCWVFSETLLKSWRDCPFNFSCAAAKLKMAIKRNSGFFGNYCDSGNNSSYSFNFVQQSDCQCTCFCISRCDFHVIMYIVTRYMYDARRRDFALTVSFGLRVFWCQ